MLALAFVLCAFGSKAIIDCWFLGSIFSWYRAWAELIREEGSWWLSRKLGELLTCKFCFSYHSSLWLTLCCLPLMPSWWLMPPWWLAARTAARFLDILEENLEGSGNVITGAESSGDDPSSGGGG